MIFNLLFLLFDAFTGSITLHRLIRPSFALWYILSLIFWRLLLHAIPDTIINYRIRIIVASAIIAILIGYIPIGTELSFQRTFIFFPFFLAGYYINNTGIIKRIRNLNKYISLSIIVFLFVVAYLLFPVFYGDRPYGVDIYGDMQIRIIQLLVAAMLCLFILRVIPEKMGFVTKIGKYTLLIYSLHAPIVKILKVLVAKAGYQPDIFASIVITTITIGIIYSVRNYKIFKHLI